MRSNQLPIDSPCHESWEAMDGDAERRFCGVCQKHVHNLSAMRHDDARALLAESAGANLCVRYSAETDGSLRFRDLVPAARLTRGLVRSAFAAVLLAACDPGQAAPIADLGESVIESIREATTPTNDGGCNYTTGPFTTFHFAPGHVLCRSNGHDDAALPPAISLTPPHEPTLDPIDIPTHPVAVPMPDPIDMPLMGQAVAFPEPTQPFVPCDPKPTSHRPPQPQFAPPPPPTYERMGDVAAPIEPPPAMGGLAVFEPPPPPPHPGFAPPPPPRPGFAPPPPPHPGFAPPPPPHPGFAPPPDPIDDRPLMGSISPASVEPERMGRIAPSPR
ncbi:hypothetical protein [Nannocystis sp.]|uniref:hypothetical protein n=1 Tax=Nannocystis sp. TaxID=1962667 RepID=UPI0025E6F280|nr:hypothetical protein [Nannocystis sp.]MBK7827089.1 hypothetical protein [Nannocystis sp.]